MSESCQLLGSKEESSWAQPPGELGSQAERRREEGRDVVQVLGWLHTRGQLQHLDIVVIPPSD